VLARVRANRIRPANSSPDPSNNRYPSRIPVSSRDLICPPGSTQAAPEIAQHVRSDIDLERVQVFGGHYGLLITEQRIPFCIKYDLIPDSHAPCCRGGYSRAGFASRGEIQTQSGAISSRRQISQQLTVRLFERVMAAKAIRAEIGVVDIALIFEQLAAVQIGDSAKTAELRRRYLALMLESLHLRNVARLPARAPDWHDINKRWDGTTLRRPKSGAR
jgi:hypothetical protein